MISKYIEHLKNKKFSDGTINFRFRQIRTLFKRNELEWPFLYGEAPAIRENKVVALALHPDLVGEIITAIKADGTPEEKALLALSTTYGVRRTEIVNLKQEDVMLEDRIIHIATAKHGRERNHLVPDIIVPILADYDFEQKRSNFSLNVLWHRIEYKANIEHTDHVGWHSIRRTLNTELRNVLPANVTMAFMRWKMKTNADMSLRYTATSYVGRNGTTKKVAGEYQDMDRQVFANHPFLKYWGESR
jgi:integrase